ncbi:MAG: transcription termination/antitermination protein NusG [Lachnospiraceae bacterium]|nr:transcription termination/antitermination protein NusG [Lachnospiraceae bacterium]
MAEEAKWYSVHTYSGYENKVKTTIEKTVKNQKLQDQIVEVMVPVQKVIGAKGKEVERKLFPGYVMIHMVMNDNTWYIVRNTRGVTGFVGPDSKPIPLTEEEVYKMGILQNKKATIDINVGDRVRVVEGPWADTESVVTNVNEQKEKITIDIEMLGRENSVEIDFSSIQKLS